MNKPLIIIGASGHGKVVADIASLMGNWSEILFLDDNPKDAYLGEYKIIGNINLIFEL